MSSPNEIWILGAAGRCGRAVATDLASRGLRTVLVGRDRARLAEVAGATGGDPRIVIAGSVAEIVAALTQARPAVVVNTIGPFLSTALPIVRAGAAGSHYVDLANELFAVTGLLGLHDEAVAAGRCLVTGAGFGLLGTESVVLKLCAGRPPAARVRVDAVPLLGGSDTLGHTVAETVLDSLVAGGFRYDGGRLVRAGVGSAAERLTLPDGSTVTTGAAPTGDLEAARRASAAPDVVCGSSELPTGPLARVVLAALGTLASSRAVRDFLVARLARLRVSGTAQRQHSFGHARVTWPDGSTLKGWLRLGDGMAFTGRVLAEVAARLARGDGKPGAYTPGALFGPALAEAAGGQFVLDPAPPAR